MKILCGIRRLVFSFWVLSLVTVFFLHWFGAFYRPATGVWDHANNGDDTFWLLFVLFTVIPWGVYFLGRWIVKGFKPPA